MTDCIFCKIASGEIPSDCVYEDEYVYVFKDINPQAPTHLLVIPKTHIASLGDITSENSALAAKCLEVIAMLRDKLGLDGGFRVISNCGEDAGQTVFHLHFHVLAGAPMGEGLLAV